MKCILVANTKGGSGKTTVATNLAGYLASLGNTVAIADLDRQKSSTNWINRRPESANPIYEHNKLKSDSKVDWLVIDSPAGFRNDKLKEAVKLADCILVPIQPSAFDMGATADFIKVLLEEKPVRKEKTSVAVIGMRVNTRTKATDNLNSFMNNIGFPVLGSLRNAQIYVTAAEEGLSIFDMRPSQNKQDVEQWTAINDWVIGFNAK